MSQKICPYSVNVSGVKLGSLFQESQSRVRVHHVLDEGHEVLGHQEPPGAPGQQVDELGGLVMTRLQHSPPKVGEAFESHQVGLVIDATREESHGFPGKMVAQRLKKRI